MRGALLVALLAGGIVAGCAEPAAPEPIVAVVGPPVPEVEPVDWTALVGSGFCARVNAVGTFSFCGLSGPALTDPTNPAGFEAVYTHGADGRDLAGGHLLLEWDAASIATEGLRVSALVLEECPDECEVNRTLGTAAGVSPLELPIDAWDLRQDMVVAVVVTPADLTRGVAASIGQEFRLTGTLSFVEDPDGDPEEADDEDEDGGQDRD